MAAALGDYSAGADGQTNPGASHSAASL